MVNNRINVEQQTLTSNSSEHNSVNGDQFKQYIEAALHWLKANQQLVNSLNVFPVPDGDTGTNMLLTMQAAYNEIASIDDSNIGRVSKNVAQGALMGARGNVRRHPFPDTARICQSTG